MIAFALRLLRFGAVATAGVVAAVILLLALMYTEHFLSTTLPKPTGHYAIGRASYYFADKAEETSANEGRKLVVWIWYPAQARSEAKPADYFPSAWCHAANASWAWAMTHLIMRDLSKVRVHSLSGAPISSEKASYPVVVMRPGGSALTLQYTTLAEDLASHGYVVVGLDAAYRTQLVVLPNGHIAHRPLRNDPEEVPLEQVNRLMMMWTNDVRFVLDRLQALNDHDDRSLLTHRLDLTRVGMFGHSFGGAQTLQVCHDDPRCKAGIDIDGMPFGNVVAEGVKQPFMFLMGDHSHDFGSQSEGRQVARDLNGIYRRLPETSRVALMIEGADHFSFSDGAVVRSHVLLSLLRMFGLVIDGKRQLETTSTCVREFFDEYLDTEAGGFLRCPHLQGVKPSKLVIDGDGS